MNFQNTYEPSSSEFCCLQSSQSSPALASKPRTLQGNGNYDSQFSDLIQYAAVKGYLNTSPPSGQDTIPAFSKPLHQDISSNFIISPISPSYIYRNSINAPSLDETLPLSERNFVRAGDEIADGHSEYNNSALEDNLLRAPDVNFTENIGIAEEVFGNVSYVTEAMRGLHFTTPIRKEKLTPEASNDFSDNNNCNFTVDEYESAVNPVGEATDIQALTNAMELFHFTTPKRSTKLMPSATNTGRSGKEASHLLTWRENLAPDTYCGNNMVDTLMEFNSERSLRSSITWRTSIISSDNDDQSDISFETEEIEDDIDSPVVIRVLSDKKDLDGLKEDWASSEFKEDLNVSKETYTPKGGPSPSNYQKIKVDGREVLIRVVPEDEDTLSRRYASVSHSQSTVSESHNLTSRNNVSSTINQTKRPKENVSSSKSKATNSVSSQPSAIPSNASREEITCENSPVVSSESNFGSDLPELCRKEKGDDTMSKTFEINSDTKVLPALESEKSNEKLTANLSSESKNQKGNALDHVLNSSSEEDILNSGDKMRLQDNIRTKNKNTPLEGDSIEISCSTEQFEAGHPSVTHNESNNSDALDDLNAFDLTEYLDYLELQVLVQRNEIERSRLNTVREIREQMESCFENTALINIPPIVFQNWQKVIDDTVAHELQAKNQGEMEESSEEVASRMRKDMEMLVNENLELHRDIDKFKRHGEENDILKQKVDNLEKRLSLLHTQLNLKKEECDNLNRKVSEFTHDLTRGEYVSGIKMEETLRQYETELRKARDERNLTEQKITEFSLLSTELQQRLIEKERDYNNLSKVNESMKEQAEGDLREVQATSSKLRLTVSELEQQNNVLKTKNEADQTVIKHLEGRVYDLEQSLNEARQSAATTLKSLEDSQIQEARFIEALEASATQMDTFRQENDSLRIKLKEAKDECKSVTRELTEKLTNDAQNTHAILQEVKNLENSLNDLRKEKTHVEEKYSQMKYENERLQRTIEIMKRKQGLSMYGSLSLDSLRFPNDRHSEVSSSESESVRESDTDSIESTSTFSFPDIVVRDSGKSYQMRSKSSDFKKSQKQSGKRVVSNGDSASTPRKTYSADETR